MYVFTLLHHEQKTFNSAIANKEENMRFIYDKTEDMWLFEDMVNDVKISVFVTRWAEAGKGPMIDFTVFADNIAECNCYEVEILTDKFKEESVEDYCKLIRDCYNSEDFLERITKTGSDIFKCHANGYFRELGRENRVMQYIKREWYKALKITSIYENCNGSIMLNKNEKPSLEYPGSRIDLICD